MGLARQRRNWLCCRVSGPLRGTFVPQKRIEATGRLLMFKRPAAPESPKAMEPPAVSRFLYRVTSIGEQKANSKQNICGAKFVLP
jgi:hypothetical protein